MAIIADGRSAGIYYTASYAPTFAKTRSNSPVRSSLSLRNNNEISQRGEKSNICLPSQSPAVVSPRESAIVLSTPNSLPNASKSLSYQMELFLMAMDPGSCKKFDNVTPEEFAVLQDKLDLVRYLYNAKEKILIVVCPSHAHESVIAIIGRQFGEAIMQSGLDNYIQILYNTTTWYQDDDRSSFQADFTIAYEAVPLLHLEVSFSQDWPVLVDKVGRILGNENTWGVLVVRIHEKDKWSKPTRKATADDFMGLETWNDAARLTQAENPFAPLSYNNLIWIEAVECSVYWFPSSWDSSDSLPAAHKLSANTSACLPDDFTDLNTELASVWENLIHDVEERCSVDGQLCNLSVDWGTVHVKLTDGLRLTGFERYLNWFGRKSHKENEKKRPAPIKRFRPSKKHRTA